MKVAVIGGKLQGTEAVCLAALAGWESILIDNRENVPARGLADRFVLGDVVKRDPEVINAMKEADFVLPANENDRLLEAVCEICEKENLRLAFSMEAYQTTKSKRKSDILFRDNGIPAPAYYPEGRAPFVIKPSGESGSRGVTVAETREEAEAFLKNHKDTDNWVIQEYVDGPSYSVEVIGKPGNYRAYAVTRVHVDSGCDCCMVSAPCDIGRENEQRLAQIGVKIAELIHLTGIMDVEAIYDGENMKVLEIDGRLPSQTPLTVFFSSGMNLLRELGDITVTGNFTTEYVNLRKPAVYEHYRRENGLIIQEGEHMMADAGPLRWQRDFCGSSIAVWDWDSEKQGSDFHGIFIHQADSKEAMKRCRSDLFEKLKLLP